VIVNLKPTHWPILVLDFVIITRKFSSPVVNPEIQLGSGILLIIINRFATGIILLKQNLDFNLSVIPLFIDALILIIWRRPLIER
jgi:hypothetical protein